MTTSSDRAPPEKTTGRPEFSRSPSGGRAPQSGDLGGHHYARFIPREELGGFAAWRPDALGDNPNARPGTDAQRSAEQQSLRQAGYQDGYRDGLAALDNFKHTFAQQMAAQLAPLLADFERAFNELEAQIADAVARTATLLARQVVRGELAARPESVALVAAEAVHAVLLSARHIRLFVHPDDQGLVQAGAGEALAARGALVLTDATLSRGGCRIESDLGSVDAGIETRLAQAAASLGQALALNDDAAAT